MRRKKNNRIFEDYFDSKEVIDDIDREVDHETQVDENLAALDPTQFDYLWLSTCGPNGVLADEFPDILDRIMHRVYHYVEYDPLFENISEVKYVTISSEFAKKSPKYTFSKDYYQYYVKHVSDDAWDATVVFGFNLNSNITAQRLYRMLMNISVLMHPQEGVLVDETRLVVTNRKQNRLDWNMLYLNQIDVYMRRNFIQDKKAQAAADKGLGQVYMSVMRRMYEVFRVLIPGDQTVYSQFRQLTKWDDSREMLANTQRQLREYTGTYCQQIVALKRKFEQVPVNTEKLLEYWKYNAHGMSIQTFMCLNIYGKREPWKHYSTPWDIMIRYDGEAGHDASSFNKLTSERKALENFLKIKTDVHLTNASLYHGIDRAGINIVTFVGNIGRVYCEEDNIDFNVCMVLMGMMNMYSQDNTPVDFIHAMKEIFNGNVPDEQINEIQKLFDKQVV